MIIIKITTFIVIIKTSEFMNIVIMNIKNVF